MNRRGAAPATKADLDAGLKGLESKIDSRIGGMEGDIRRLMIESVATNERMRSLGEGLRQEMRDVGSNVKNQLDAFTARMEMIWRESVVFPKLLDEQGAVLRGHERRIAALEARQSP